MRNTISRAGRGRQLPPLENMRRAGRGYCLLALLASAGAWSAETSLTGGAGVSYAYDDNINVSPFNQISLNGWQVDGFLKTSYATSRFRTSADLKLEFERYMDASLETDDPLLLAPEASDFDSDNQDLKADIAYDWEHQTLSLFGRYWRDSTLNTQFIDTGFGGQRALEGATRRTLSTLEPAWNWRITERQSLDTTVKGQTVDYESDLYVDFEYVTADIVWGSMLTERFLFQLKPFAAYFENEAAVPVRSQYYALQAGFKWQFTEHWDFDLLAGGARIHSEYGDEGLVITDPDTGEAELVEDQDSSGFMGDLKLGTEQEHYGVIFKLSSNIYPSGNGILRQGNQARLTSYWQPLERLRLNFVGRVGRNESTDDRIQDRNDFGELGLRIAYRFASQWWLSARYRFRQQQLERFDDEAGRSNAALLTVSYYLPEEIL